MAGAVIKWGSNGKLGRGCGSWSRPVGMTCPKSCPWLGRGCYAERIAARRPNVARSWSQGVELSGGTLRRDLQVRPRRARAVRVHTGGDFGRDDRLDHRYVLHVLAAFRDRPLPGWAYTHFWRQLAPYRAAFVQRGVQMFASVHTVAEAKEAAALGYRLAIDAGRRGKGLQLPVKTEACGVTALTCPEQRKGVTCDMCGYCWRRATGHVVFWRH